MLCARDRPLQLGGLVAGLITPVQLGFKREEFILLRERLSGLDVVGHATPRLAIRNGLVEVETALLELSRGHLSQG